MSVAKRPRTVLIGFGPTGLSALRSLIADVDVLGVARGSLDDSDPFIQLANKHNIPISNARIRREIADFVRQHQPDYVIVSSFNRTFDSATLKLCPFINVHYAPLPRLRGNAPMNWALINGDRGAAVTIHLVAEQLDSGPILFQRQILIEQDDTIKTLLTKLNNIQEQELGSAVLAAHQGYEGTYQEHDKATYGCARNAEDGEINWHSSADSIHRLVRALVSPYPGAFTYHQLSKLTIHRAESLERHKHYEGVVPGRVVDISPTEGCVDVLTGHGVLRIYELAAADAAPQRAAGVITSRRARLGLQKTELLQRIVELENRLNEYRQDMKLDKQKASHGERL